MRYILIVLFFLITITMASGISMSLGGDAGTVSATYLSGDEFSLDTEMVVGDGYVSMTRESNGDAIISESAGKFSLTAAIGDKASSEYVAAGDQVYGEVKQSGMTILNPDDVAYTASCEDCGIAVQGSGDYQLTYVAGLSKPLHLNGGRIIMTVVEPVAGTAPVDGANFVGYSNAAKESLNAQEAQDMGGKGTMNSQFLYQTRDMRIYTVTPGLSTRYYMTGTNIRDSQNHNDGKQVIDWGVLSTSYNALSYIRYDGNSHIAEVDMRLNSAVGWNSQKLLSVEMHEMGHWAGLGDEWTDTSQIMYGSWNGQGTTLGAGDHAGLAALYAPGTGIAYQ
jgi:hypothetical protein